MLDWFLVLLGHIVMGQLSIEPTLSEPKQYWAQLMNHRSAQFLIGRSISSSLY